MHSCPDPLPTDLPGKSAAVIGEWAVTDELNQRVGCGVLTALTLPLWFLLLGLAVSSNLALVVAAGLFVMSLAAGPVVLRRSRRLPRMVRIEHSPGIGADMVLLSRSGECRRSLDDLRRLEVGASVGPWPIRLGFAKGSRLRLPADIENIGTLLEELRRRSPQLTMTGLDRLHQPGECRAPDHTDRPGSLDRPDDLDRAGILDRPDDLDRPDCSDGHDGAAGAVGR